MTKTISGYGCDPIQAGRRHRSYERYWRSSRYGTGPDRTRQPIELLLTYSPSLQWGQFCTSPRCCYDLFNPRGAEKKLCKWSTILSFILLILLQPVLFCSHSNNNHALGDDETCWGEKSFAPRKFFICCHNNFLLRWRNEYF